MDSKNLKAIGVGAGAILIGIVVIMPDLGNGAILALAVPSVITAEWSGPPNWFTSLLSLVVGVSSIVP